MSIEGGEYDDCMDVEVERCEDCGRKLEDCTCIDNLFMTSDDYPD